MNDNPDDYDFTPTSISPNLASLFGNSPVNFENSSLIYTAPKQPKPGITTDAISDTKTESSVICARVVQVWKLTDGKYAPAGKHGLAIIGSSLKTSYEVILYKEKRNVIMRAKICPNLELTLKKDEFVSFYDSVNDNWLIKFNSSDDCTVIIKHIEKYGGKVKTEVQKENTSVKQIVKNTEPSTIDSTSENRAKDDILSRIARMGQSILPNKNVESEEHLKTDLNVSTDVKDHKIKDNQFSPPTASANEYKIKDDQYVITTTSALSPTHAIQPPRQIQNIPNTVLMGQSITYDPLHFYVAENRAHNSEVRINLSQISEKLNTIMKLVDIEKPSVDNNRDALTSKIKVLQLKNENLEKELATFQQENTKLQLQIKQQDDILKMKEENRLQSRLFKEKEAAMIVEYEKQISTYKNNITHLSETVEKQNSEIEELKKNLLLCQEDTTMKMAISEMENTIADLKIKLTECESDRHENTSSMENKEKSANLTAMLKDAMNGMYGKIVANLNEGQLQTSEVSDIIAQNIKFTTLKIIQNFQQIYENESEIN